MLAPSQLFTGQLRRHPSCTMACRILVIPQFETTQYLMVFQRVHTTTVTGQTFYIQHGYIDAATYVRLYTKYGKNILFRMFIFEL